MKGATGGLQDRNRGRVGVGGKIKRRLSEVNARAISRGLNELVGKFKMAAGDVIRFRGQVLEHTYILTGIERGW